MELEKLLRSLLYRLESIDDESKSTVIEDKVNKLSHQIDQLKSDLSDVASLFHLLKDNKERLTLQNTKTTFLSSSFYLKFLFDEFGYIFSRFFNAKNRRVDA